MFTWANSSSYYSFLINAVLFVSTKKKIPHRKDYSSMLIHLKEELSYDWEVGIKEKKWILDWTL